MTTRNKDRKREARKGYDRAYCLIREIVNAEDPMGQIGMGAPEEEYEPEVSLVVSGTKTCESVESLQTMIHGIFVSWFDERTAGPAEKYKSVAERIWALRDAVSNGLDLA